MEKDCFLFVVVNPSTGAVIGNVPDMNAEDTESAVKSAYDAFQTWKKTSAKVYKQIPQIYIVVKRFDSVPDLTIWGGGI